MSPLVKVAVGGAGAFLLYNYAKDQGWLDGSGPVDSGVTANGGDTVPVATKEPTSPIVVATTTGNQTGCPPAPPAYSTDPLVYGARMGLYAQAVARCSPLLPLMQSKAGSDPVWKPQMNVHEWCYLYSQVRSGKSCPSPPAGVPASMTMPEWFAIMGPLGVSGIRGISGYSG